MTIREARAKARSKDKQRIDRLVVVLLERAATKGDRRCMVCGRASFENEVHFVIPVTYIAACLVTQGLAEHLGELPLRTAFLCRVHSDTFDALFVDPADPRWNLARLERRAEVLGGVMSGSLLVVGGPKAQKVAREFQAAIVALKKSS